MDKVLLVRKWYCNETATNYALLDIFKMNRLFVRQSHHNLLVVKRVIVIFLIRYLCRTLNKQGKKLLGKIQNLKHSVQIVRSFIFQIHSGFPDETILTRFNPHSGQERNLQQLMVFRNPKALYVIKVTFASSFAECYE